MSIFGFYAAVWLKRCKTVSKLLLTTNKNVYTRFRLEPKSMTLDDLEGQYTLFTLCACLSGSSLKFE